jgi:hypothetical protein
MSFSAILIDIAQVQHAGAYAAPWAELCQRSESRFLSTLVQTCHSCARWSHATIKLQLCRYRLFCKTLHRHNMLGRMQRPRRNCAEDASFASCQHWPKHATLVPSAHTLPSSYKYVIICFSGRRWPSTTCRGICYAHGEIVPKMRVSHPVSTGPNIPLLCLVPVRYHQATNMSLFAFLVDVGQVQLAGAYATPTAKLCRRCEFRILSALDQKYHSCA